VIKNRSPLLEFSAILAFDGSHFAFNQMSLNQLDLHSFRTFIWTINNKQKKI